MASSQVSYCLVEDVAGRLYTGQSSGQRPPNAARDGIISDDIAWLSREFENETGRPLNGFAPSWDVRLYSGRGLQTLDVEEFAALSKLEYNRTVSGTPSWTDVTGEIASGGMAFKPLRFWPKRQIFRQNTWIVDPWQTGNVRLTGVFGCVQPDLTIAPPTGQSPPWNGLTDAQIQAISPNPSGPTYGWWVTPTDVRKAVAEWTLYTWNAGRAGYGDQPGKPQGGGTLFMKDIPPGVRRVIDRYRGGALKLALIGIDGSDAKEEALGAAGGITRRFAGWHSYDPTGLHPENNW